MSFEKLNSLNLKDKVENRAGLTYLSWAHAWGEFKKIYSDAQYKIIKNTNNLPYFESDVGAMVYTEVTAGGMTYEMWLPVMDGSNKTMKKERYKYSTRAGERFVEAYTMFDINKTIMRCLVKNLAMFGLGLYIYCGEDFPEVEKEETKIGYVRKSIQAQVSVLSPVIVEKINSTKTLEDLKSFFEFVTNECKENGTHLLLYKEVNKRKEEIKKEMGMGSGVQSIINAFDAVVV